LRETASKSGLLLSGCLRWAHPAARWYQDRLEDATKREDGKDFHLALHLHAQDLPAATPEAVRLKIEHARKYFTNVLMPRCEWVQTEVAMGINFTTGEVECPNISEREYPQKDDWFYGTADLVCKLKSGGLLIADWKTGESDGAEEQLKSLAMMARVLFPEHSVIYISVLSAQDDQVYAWEREVAKEELDQHQVDINVSLKAARATPKPRLPVIGPHCTAQYCPHMAKCPATHADMASIAPDDLGTGPVEWEEKPTDAAHAGKMAIRMAAIKRALKYYDGTLKDYVNSGGLAQWNGWEWTDSGNGFRVRRIKG
jgi:hypothetical protein